MGNPVAKFEGKAQLQAIRSGCEPPPFASFDLKSIGAQVEDKVRFGKVFRDAKSLEAW
jgi:hypothetical protein